MARYYRISFLCLCLVMFFSGSIWAQGNEVLPKGEFASWHYKIGLDERFRYEYRRDFDFSKSLKDDGGLFFNRVRINAKASLKDEYLNDILEIFAEGLDAQVGGYRINALESQKDNFDFHQGYMKIYDIAGMPFEASLGRQELKYGKGRLIAAPTWANRIRSFDAAVLHFVPAGSYADVFYAQDVKYDDLDPNRSSDEEFLAGFYGGYGKNKVITLIESYFLAQVIKSGSSDIERY